MTALTAILAPEIANWFVAVMGIGVVFTGLVCIIILCSIMSAVIRAIEKNKKPAAAPAPVAAAPVAQASPIANRGEFIAAVSVAIAEELGTDVSAIRIVSVKPM